MDQRSKFSQPDQDRLSTGNKGCTRRHQAVSSKSGREQSHYFRLSRSSKSYIRQVVTKNSSYEDVAKQEKEDVAFRRLVEETAQEFGVSFAPGALEYLAGKIGAHPRLGVEETKKWPPFSVTMEKKSPKN